jgi:hypothetical protein
VEQDGYASLESARAPFNGTFPDTLERVNEAHRLLVLLRCDPSTVVVLIVLHGSKNLIRFPLPDVYDVM